MSLAANVPDDLGNPIGEMITVQGRAVHVYRQGSGSPTIWLEHGWAGVTLSWQPFIHQLAQHTRVCTYDRAGTGWSAPSPTHRTAQNEANEFAALIEMLGETDPFIILAWSGGGLVAQLYAAEHPERVAGLILMDAVPPDYDQQAMQAFPHRYWQQKQDYLETIRHNALAAAGGTLTDIDISGWFDPQTLTRYGDRYRRLLLSNPQYWWTYYWQNQFGMVSGTQVRAKVIPTNMPLKILIATQLPAEADDYQHTLAQMWQSMQSAQATLSTQSEVIRVDAGHAIFRDKPETVIDAVLAMISDL